MQERIVNLFRLCMQAKEKGHHCYYNYSPHVDGITISVFKNGWKYDKKPDKSFVIFMDCFEALEQISCAEAYLKELVSNVCSR